MSTAEALFVDRHLAGFGLTRSNWRPDLRPYGRQTRFLDVTLPPEKYVRVALLRVIRSLNAVGGLLLFGAAAVAAREILRVMRIV